MNKQTPFTTIIDSFVAFKRAAGHKYNSESVVLRRLGLFFEEQGVQNVILDKNTIDVWCRQKPHESRSTYSSRVSLIRQLGFYLADRGYQVIIPETVRKAKNNLFVPYIFSHNEMNRIFHVIDNLPIDKNSNSNIVYPVLFRVLYGCGLRIGEALALKIHDVDVVNGILSIKHAKYDKKRLVPMSESLTRVCQKYFDNCLIGIPQDEFFFMKKHGGGRSKKIINTRFRRTLWECGIPYLGKGKGPRLHDIRHTFCCHSIKQMSDNNIDLYCALPVLSVYIGHSTIKATERYIRLTRGIYPEIEKQMELFSGSIYPEVLRNE